MRILVLTNLYPNPFEPTRGLYNRLQVRHLAASHEVTVISPILWTDEWSARRRGKCGIKSGRANMLDGIEVYYPRYFYTPKVFRGAYGRFFKASVKRVFHRIANEFEPDIVFAPWAYPDGWAAVELAQLRRLPVVIKIHGSDIHQLERFPGRLRCTVAALQKASGIVVVSEELKARVTRFGIDPAKVCVVYNGVDTSVFCPQDGGAARSRLGLREKSPMLLAVGNLVPVKAHHVLLESVARLVQSGVDVQCHLLGDGPLKSSLEAKAEELQIMHHFRMHGPRPHDELPDWYRAADLVVLPSLAEGVPNVILEAMACGTPFVASQVGGIAEVVPSNYPCRLVQPADSGELTTAIRESLAFKSAAPRSAFAARSHQDAAAEIEQCLAEALKNTPRNGSSLTQTLVGANSR